MVKKKNGKWEAECEQCGWKGEADTKEAARELLRKHLDIHRTPEPVTKSEEPKEVTSPPSKWPDLQRPGSDPIGKIR